MAEESTLYHYCSNVVFCSIIEEATIWFSALSLSNDSMEGRLVGELLIEIARADQTEESKVGYLQAIQEALLDYSPGFGFCLSKRGDILSQWRGYADDGKGVSIGFNRQCLFSPPVSPILVPPTLEDVIYDRGKQIEILQDWYNRIKANFETFNALHDRQLDVAEIGGSLDYSRNLTKANLHRSLLQIHERETFLMKSSGFKEEEEVRMILMENMGSDVVEYRSVGNKVIPYVPYKLPKNSKRINKVILGPKNSTPIPVVESMLKRHGLGDIEVVPSAIPYR